MALAFQECAHGCGRLLVGKVVTEDQSIYCGKCGEWTLIIVKKAEEEE